MCSAAAMLEHKCSESSKGITFLDRTSKVATLEADKKLIGRERDVLDLNRDAEEVGPIEFATLMSKYMSASRDTVLVLSYAIQKSAVEIVHMLSLISSSMRC
jgi:hypothetical protein